MEEIVKQVMTILRGMWKFRWQGLIVSWIVAAIGVVVVFRIPDQYEATARIYVDTQSILKPLMSGLAVQPNIEQQIAILSRTLLSRPNIEKLVRMADLDLKSESKRDQDELIDKLMSSIAIRDGSRDNLYSLAFRDADQEKAKRVIQSLVSIFVESSLGSSRKDTDAAKTFLNEQIKAFEAKLEEAEARMKEFQLRNLDRVGPDGRDTLTRMSEAQGLLDSARLQLREAEQARDAARRQLAEARGQAPSTALPDLLQGAGGGVAGASVATPEIDGRIDAQRRNLDALLQRYTDRHPDVAGTRRLISELEELKRKEVAELQRKAAARAAASPPGSTVNVNADLAVQELNRMLATAEVQVASMKARVDEYGRRHAALRESLRTAPQIEAEAAQLNRDYAVTKKNYEDLVARRQSAVMSGELDVASGVAEFRLIDPPRVSPKPVAPNRLLLLPVALVAALAAGLFTAFAASQLRPTFDDASELRAKTGMPLLGVVTMVMSDVDRRVERMGTIRFVTATGGLVGLFVAGLIAMSLMGRYGG